jgi:hypothetical protein
MWQESFTLETHFASCFRNILSLSNCALIGKVDGGDHADFRDNLHKKV